MSSNKPAIETSPHRKEWLNVQGDGREKAFSPSASGARISEGDDIAIRVSNVSKCYQIYDAPGDRLKQFILPRLRRFSGQIAKQYYREFWALKDVSFEVKRGETVGIIGLNGSGKSTLLQIICGTLTPTDGIVETHGRVAALLELGSGFNPDFSGRENVYMNASVLGLSKEEIDVRFDGIAAFADIGDFIDQSVKTYSSGMVVRLAFAVSVCVDPDILVIDEALAVGDAAFQFKCLERMKRLAESGTTLLFVSHDVGMVKSFCHDVIYLEQGRQKLRGLPEMVAEQYFLDIRDEQRRHTATGMPIFRKKNLRDSDLPAFGTEQGSIISACFLPDNEEKAAVGYDETVRIRIEVEYVSKLTGAALSVILSDRRMLDVAGRFFFLGSQKECEGKAFAAIEVEFESRLWPGNYFITLRLESRGMGGNFFPVEKQPAALSFEVTPYDPQFLGIVDIGMREAIEPLLPALPVGDKQNEKLLLKGDVFTETIRSLKGGITEDEALFLRDLTAKVGYGWILEIGSYRGKSAVAISEGSLKRRHPISPGLYCIEPHCNFVGVYGGQFGPEDRGAYYRAMLDTGAYRETALINLGSDVVAPGWKVPLGMIFVDGDHSYEGVLKDVECWRRHLIPGGFLVFDDAKDPAIGPHRVVQELHDEHEFVRIDELGKIVALQKLGYHAAPPVFLPAAKLRVLVVTTKLTLSGGLLRFERMGKIMRNDGHEVAICAIHDPATEKWEGTIPVIDLATAWNQQWDVTMVPGRALFDEAIYEDALKIFTDRRFGLRVQHILNNGQYTEAFLAVNKMFDPHLVIFNNRHWESGSFTQFSGNEFHYLVGAVDYERFSNIHKLHRSADEKCVIGGQARKNPVPLIEALNYLPEQYELSMFGNCPVGLEQKYCDLITQGRLHLLGELSDAELDDFYASIDLVVSTENNAGWANIVAEAMAASIPVICTAAGTLEIAQSDETAILLDSLEPKAVAVMIRRLWDDPALRKRLVQGASETIRAYDWQDYAQRMLDLLQRGRNSHYFRAPEVGLFGKWPFEARLEGLENILKDIEGKTVLDLGAAEGVISRLCLDSGAALLHGVEIDPVRVQKATKLCRDYAEKVTFTVADLNEQPGIFEQTFLQRDFDIVLYLGIHQHLTTPSRQTLLRHICDICKETLVIRMPEDVLQLDKVHEILVDSGYSLLDSRTGLKASFMGGLRVYRRNAVMGNAVVPSSLYISTEVGRDDAPRMLPISAPMSTCLHAPVRTRHFISFPKSGRSWLRYILNQLGVDQKITFHHDGFEFNDGSMPAHDFDILSRIKQYSKVDRIVYLKRDPRDVIASLYYQITGRFKDYFNYQGTISDFIRDQYFGAQILVQFLVMWEDLMKMPNVLVVEYEECHRDLGANIQQILAHFDLHVSDESIIQAIEGASFERMKILEDSCIFPEPWLNKRNDAPKLRNGKVSGYLNEFTDEDLDYLNHLFFARCHDRGN